jgi:hypothetical protein
MKVDLIEKKSSKFKVGSRRSASKQKRKSSICVGVGGRVVISTPSYTTRTSLSSIDDDIVGKQKIPFAPVSNQDKLIVSRGALRALLDTVLIAEARAAAIDAKWVSHNQSKWESAALKAAAARTQVERDICVPLTTLQVFS